MAHSHDFSCVVGFDLKLRCGGRARRIERCGSGDEAERSCILSLGLESGQGQLTVS